MNSGYQATLREGESGGGAGYEGRKDVIVRRHSCSSQTPGKSSELLQILGLIDATEVVSPAKVDKYNWSLPMHN